jgi:excisionase family DNA binding protein
MIRRVALADPVLSVEQVAEMIGVHHSTIRKWIRKGELPAVKLSGKCLRIRARALQDFLVARTHRATGVSAS